MSRLNRFVIPTLCVVVLAAAQCFGGIITVSDTSDNGPNSLRAAIAAAAPGDTINFSVRGTITLTSGPLVISKNLRISGPGASNLAVSGNNVARVFSISSGATVSISGLTITKGSAGANLGDNGGGAYNAGTLILNYVTVSNNTAGGGNGGGIFNDNGGTLFVTNSTISNNSVSICCGAAQGGGISNNTGATATLTNSTVYGNSGALGGGIFTTGMLTITNSTLSSNSAQVCCGGGLGGGIYIGGGTVTVNNTTFFGNYGNVGSQSISNGGLYTPGGTLSVTNSTLSGGIYNEASTTLKSSIVAGGAPDCSIASGAITSLGYNLVDDDSCHLSGIGDLNNTPAGLDPNGLQNNGGPTQTIALLTTSPAVDAIPLNPADYCKDANGASVNTDQRGFTRPQGSKCDIGAFEIATDNLAAQLNGDNTFTGNETVNGNVTATSFFGDGSGLTGINAATATTAANALALGGLAPSAYQLAGNYARTDTGNSLNGNQQINGSLNVSGVVSGGGAAFGTLTSTNAVLLPSATASPNNPAPSFPLEFVASSFFNGSPVNQWFRWQAEGNGAANAGTLNLLYASGNNAPAETGLSIAQNGVITFAPDQTFPISAGGSITGVLAGSGLLGGGTNGNVALAVDSTVARTNAANSFTGNQNIAGSVSASSFSGSGAGLTNVNATTVGGVPAGSFARTDVPNNFSGNQNVAGAVNATTVIGQGACADGNCTPGIQGNGYTAVQANGYVYGVNATATAGPAIVGTSVPDAGVSGTGVYGVVGTSGNASGAGGVFNASNGADILRGTKSFVQVFRVNASGQVSSTGEAIGATGVASASTSGFNSGGLDLTASVFDGSNAVAQMFRWQAEPASAGSTSASAGLNLLFGSGTNPPAETGLSIAKNGVITFAPGQTFPGTGSGTVTGVTAGSGLSGGGTTGNVTVGIPVGGVTNAMLANPSLTVTAGTGLTGGGGIALGGTTTLALASQACAPGNAVTAHPFTCSPFATLGQNNFVGAQTVSGGMSIYNTSYNGSPANGLYASTNSSYSASGSGYLNSAVMGVVSGSAGGNGVYGLYPASTGTYGTGVYGVSTNGPGILGQGTTAGVVASTSNTSASAAAGVFNNNASSNTGNILLGQYQGVNEFAVDAKGDVTANGNVAAAGSVTIGTGGTPILKHMSVPQSLPSSFNGVKLAPGSCTVATFSFTSAADGDTIALGPSSLLMSANVVLSAWASNGNVNVRICNPTGTPTTLPVPPSGSALTIRIDLWKH